MQTLKPTLRAQAHRGGSSVTKKVHEKTRCLITLMILGSCFLLTAQLSLAQVPITASGLNTQISAPIIVPSGMTQHNITGGTRPGNGPNLFHSFGEFGVPVNNIANFLNETALPTTNILGRVTEGNPSNIFGTIQTTGFGNANLFLMNPAGFLFGADATVNVGGMVAFTTADYLRLTDGVRFNAIPGPQDALLSVAPIAAFGFLGPNPPAPITLSTNTPFPESQLVGGPLEFVGGPITITNGSSLALPLGGVLKMASVASAGEVLVTPENQPLGINGVRRLGDVSIEGGIRIFAGSVFIRGGQLTVEEGGSIATRNATLQGEKLTLNGAIVANDPIALGVLGQVNLEATKSITIGDNAGVFATNAFGTPGSVTVSAPLVKLQGGTIRTDAVAAQASPITITADDVQLHNGVISANSRGTGLTPGGAGTINITAARKVNIRDTAIAADNTTGAGDPGHITIEAGRKVDIKDSSVSAQSTLGNGGTINVEASKVRLINSQLNTSVSGGPETVAGNIGIDASAVRLVTSQILSTAVEGQGGAITITTEAFRSKVSVVDASSQSGLDGTVTIQP